MIVIIIIIQQAHSKP